MRDGRRHLRRDPASDGGRGYEASWRAARRVARVGSVFDRGTPATKLLWLRSPLRPCPSVRWDAPRTTSALPACSAAICSDASRCVTEISDKTERGKLVNAAWHRYGIINSLSLGAVLAGWLGARGKEAAPNQLSEAERRLAVAKDVLVGVVAVTGAVTAAEGVRFSRQAPGGAVPLDDGDHTAAEASEAQHRAKARLNALGLASLAADLALVGVNAALAQEGFRRPPRRRIRRWRD